MDQVLLLPTGRAAYLYFHNCLVKCAPVVSGYWFKAWVLLRDKGYHSTQYLEEAVSAHKTSSVVTFVTGKWGLEGQQCDITCWRRMEKRHLQSKISSSFFFNKSHLKHLDRFNAGPFFSTFILITNIWLVELGVRWNTLLLPLQNSSTL